MKGSYKLALLIAAGLLVVVLGYYIAQNDGDAPAPEAVDLPEQAALDEPADEDAIGADDAEPPLAGPGERIARAPRPGPTAEPGAPAPGATPPPSADPFLDSLRQSIAAANGDTPPPEADPTAGGANQPADAGAPPVAGDATAPPSPPPATTPPRRDALARANGTLGVDAPSPAASGAGSPVQTPTPTDNGAPAAPATETGNGSAAADTTTRTDGAGAGRPTAPSPTTRDYTIRSGDTFSRIAAQLYDDESRWVDIAQANPLVDPARLQVGQVIRLPQGTTSPAPRTDAAETGGRSPRGGVAYTIRARDTLSSIAQQHYNDPTLWRVIYDANRNVIGGNPDRIPAGQQIVVPPAPNGAR